VWVWVWAAGLIFLAANGQEHSPPLLQPLADIELTAHHERYSTKLAVGVLS